MAEEKKASTKIEIKEGTKLSNVKNVVRINRTKIDGTYVVSKEDANNVMFVKRVLHGLEMGMLKKA